MSSERWERIKALHARAAELTGEAREAFLAEQCAGDAELRRRVEELLGNQVEDFFLQPPKASSVDSSEVQPDLTGRVLGGEYELLRLIGTGGSGGAVYVARQRSLDREVAIKILPVPAAVSPRHLERFRREANAAARLHHPGIVPIYGLGDLDGAPYYAMEFVPGGDLHDALQRLRDGEEGPVPAPRTEAGIATMVRLVAEVADALQLAHDAGIVHRDIKPQNLVIGAGGQLQIVDFGLARDESLGTITLPDEIQGTPHYMSPEQAHVSKQKVDHRTDVYSLGVVLYEMLTLRRPFEGRTSREIIDSIEHREARRVGRRNPSIPVDLETICHGAIDKDREARYPSARELAADLRRFLAGEPIRMRPPTLARRVRRFVQRNRGRSIAVAAGALALVAGIAGTSWRQHARAQEQLPHLSLRTEPADFFDAAGNRIVPEVWLRPLPLFDLLPGEKLALGSAPLDGVPVEPGTYRVVVHVEGVGSAELTRELEPGRDEDLLAYVRPTAEVTRGMVRFEEAELTFRNAPEERTGCGLDGETHELAAYWIEQHEVSFGEYRAFLADTGRARPALWKNWNTSLAADDLPVVGVSWEAARAYAEWAGKRLVTHPEWERAGRGLEGRRFPWIVAPGEEAALRGNLTAVDDGDHGGSSAGFANYLRNVRPVDSHPEARTPEGLYHMYGNVAEFTESKVIDRTGDGLEVQHEERTRLGNKWDAQSPERQEFFKMGFTEHDKIGAGRAGAIGDTGFRCAKSVGP